MDPGIPLSPTEIYELVAVVGGLGATGVLGLLVVRRARAARRRQIEELGEARPALSEAGRASRGGRATPEPTTPEPERTPQPELAELAELAPQTSRPAARGTPAAASAWSPSPRTAPRPSEVPAVPDRAPRAPAPPAEPGSPAVERAGQVVPFPFPVPAPAPPTPAVETGTAAVPKKKDAAALAPGLARTRSGWISRLGEIFAGRKELDQTVVDDIEKVLLTADIGVRTSQKLLEEIRSSLSRKELKETQAVWTFLRQRSSQILAHHSPDVAWDSAKPFVLLVIGVNGSGKTTTIGKLAAKLAADGKKVLLAAGDTFRAAAAEQLEVWASRTGATIVRGKEGADPSSVIFDGVKRAVAEGFDVVIADTAGRLHTKTDLMDELQKVRRVVGKASAGAPHETWLVIDSTSGQNAIAQAQIFTQAMAVSGIVLTKLDGTAKGGVILGIADQLQLPVRFVGIGERVEDLRAFDADEFVEALYEGPPSGP